jgi:hypothetical protein
LRYIAIMGMIVEVRVIGGRPPGQVSVFVQPATPIIKT